MLQELGICFLPSNKRGLNANVQEWCQDGEDEGCFRLMSAKN